MQNFSYVYKFEFGQICSRYDEISEIYCETDRHAGSIRLVFIIVRNVPKKM